MSFRIIAKLGLLLVLIGFFMPIACNMNGFQIADAMFQANQAFNGLLMWLIFLSAVGGIAIGVMLFLKKNIKVLFDFVAIGVCALSAIIVFFSALQEHKLQSGGIFIIIGLIVTIALQVYSSFIKKE